jgi:hypothetical protein
MSAKKLLFVYNADSGFFGAMSDYAHKIISPNTYECNLCMITYSMMGMKKQWKEFLEEQNDDIEFLHKDEFNKSHPDCCHELPAVFIWMNNQPVEVLSAKKINTCRTADDLIRLVQELD